MLTAVIGGATDTA